MFAAVARKSIANVTQAADELSFPAGHVLINEGHANTEVFVVETGVASVAVGDEVVAEIHAGEVFGELSFFDPGPATATVVAKTDMTALVIPHNRFDAIVKESPEILESVVRDLAARLRDSDARPV